MSKGIETANTLQHRIPDMSTRDLLLTRDELISAREDLGTFYDVRFTPVTALNDSNPGGTPFLRVPLQTEIATMSVRLVGQGIEDLLGDLDGTIDKITEEIIDRTGKKLD